MLAGAEAGLQSELGLTGPDYFLYLSHSRAYQVEGIDDRAEFQDTMKAMNVMGITQGEQQEILRLLAAILYLGNVTFQKGAKGDDSQIADPQGVLWFLLSLSVLLLLHMFINQLDLSPLTVVEMFAHLIQSDVQSCGKALCYRTISTGTQGRSARVSTYACPQNVEGVCQ